MSETEHYTGKLIPTGKSVEQYMEGVEISKYCDTAIEHFNEVLSDDAIDVNGLVFEIKRERINPYEDIMLATKNEDGSYDFEVKYYNGGCGFGEAIETAISGV